MRRFLRWLLRWVMSGSRDMHMDRRWLADRQQLRVYEEYTRRQNSQGQVVSVTVTSAEEVQRAAFWARVEATRQGWRPKVTRFTRG